MPNCQRCGEEFSSSYQDNGIVRDFSKRKYCVKCRPFGASKAIPIKERTVFECVVCSKPLKGRQSKFCSLPCKTQSHSSYPKQKDRRISRKLKLIEMGGGACAICGYKTNIAAFHFHHRDPSKKDFLLDSTTMGKESWNEILEEFAKCILLCANCHAEMHHPDMIYAKLKKEFEGIEVY